MDNYEKRGQNLLGMDAEDVELFFLKNSEYFEDAAPQHKHDKYAFLGNVDSIMPSSKFNSTNPQSDCPVCKGQKYVKPRAKKRVVKRAEERLMAFAKRILKRQGAAEKDYEERIKKAKVRAYNTACDDCPCCYGLGSISQIHDELWLRALEDTASQCGMTVEIDRGSVYLNKTCDPDDDFDYEPDEPTYYRYGYR